ncbi:MAG: precorrin-2 C(20)-methyltransferase [Atribacterota bacterium]
MNGKLYGVGVGPGDPELLTVKAIRILQEVDAVVIPKGGKESVAYQVVKPYLRGVVLFLPFSMVGRKDEGESFERGVTRIREFLAEGKRVAFVTLGDPLLYSTFVVLWRLLPGVEVEIIPGVSSFQAAAAKLKIPLVQGKECLAILSGESFTEAVLDSFESIVVFKVNRQCKLLCETLRKRGFVGGLVSRLGWKDEVVMQDFKCPQGQELDYFSLLVARKQRP